MGLLIDILWLFFHLLVAACLTACSLTSFSASGQQTEAQQTAIPAQPEVGRATPPYRLAVLPWKTTRRESITEFNGLSALRTSVVGGSVVPVFSAYDLYVPQSTLFAPDEQHRLSKRVWGWRHPGQGPWPEAVWEVGRQLQVDAVLVYGMEPNPGTDYLWVYLYDIPYHQHYVLRGECVWYETQAAGVLATLTHTLLGKFHDYRTQTGAK